MASSTPASMYQRRVSVGLGGCRIGIESDRALSCEMASARPARATNSARKSGEGNGTREHGVRRRHRRRWARRPGRGDPAAPAQCRAGPRGYGLRARKGLRDRGSHPVGGRVRHTCADRAVPGLEGARSAAHHAGHRGPLPLSDREGGRTGPAQLRAADDEERRQLCRQPWQSHPLAGRAGAGAGS